MTKETRVRFAPSPTGFLHIGGARTALFNWLFAKSTGGKFLLRIEDTDTERSKAEYTEDIMASLKWLGMEWDETPIYQSKRFEKYRSIALELLEKKQAFKCDCTLEELDTLRKKFDAEKKPFRYPGICHSKTQFREKYVLRIKSFVDGETHFKDLIRGDITFQNKDVDDWVIQRSDGAPTYNFCVVIDDFDQKITHVLRGDDHINNTPKQIQLYKILGYEIPEFAHLPMILGADKQKLSKRHGAVSTLEYRKMGYLPEALINFIVRMGWSHGDQEVFTTDELKKFFSVDKIGKSSAVFNTEKLNWISGLFFQKAESKYLFDYLKRYFEREIDFMKEVDESRAIYGTSIIQGKVKNYLEMIEQFHCLFGTDPVYSIAHLKTEEKEKMSRILKAVLPVISQSEFQHKILNEAVKVEAEKIGEKSGAVAQAIRFAVTGGKVSPALYEMLEAQSKPVVVRRIESCLKALS